MNDHPDLPVLTEISGEPSDLPVLTSVVAPPKPAPADLSATGAHMRPLSPAEVDQLLRHLESHLEHVFAQKLNQQLEQLQKLAVELAISEFKAELPRLLIDALKDGKPV